jgi:hypothetical protein
MITDVAHVNAAVSFYGRPYGTGPERLMIDGSYVDCSGLIAISHRKAGGGEVGAYVSSSLYSLCRNQGRIIPFSQAVNTPGALLFRPENPLLGIGPLGHVVMVRSPGITIESRGGYGVGSWPISRLTWSSQAGLLPSVYYKGITAPISAPVIPTTIQEVDDEMTVYIITDKDAAGHQPWAATNWITKRILGSKADANLGWETNAVNKTLVPNAKYVSKRVWDSIPTVKA